MEDTGRQRQSLLPLQREFVVSRLEEQILIRVFELVIPIHRQVTMRVDPPRNQVDRSVIKTIRSQGANSDKQYLPTLDDSPRHLRSSVE
jgi:hypothetical protein